jgi:hypothetical protein
MDFQQATLVGFFDELEKIGGKIPGGFQQLFGGGAKAARTTTKTPALQPGTSLKMKSLANVPRGATK